MSTGGIFGAGFSGLSEKARLERCAKELEGVVVSQLFETMRKTVPEGGFLEKSPAEDIFRSMLDGELARVVADRSPFGLAEAITRELSASLPAAGAPAAASAASAASAAPAAAPAPAPAPPAPAGRSWRA